MEFNLTKYGAPPLPHGYRYRLQLVEPHGDMAELSVIIVRKRCRKIWKFHFQIVKRVASARILVGKDITASGPMNSIIKTAERLYKDTFEKNETTTRVGSN